MTNELIKFADGKIDATEAVQKILDRAGEICFEKGDYLITQTLLIHSNSTIIADENARFIMDGNVEKHRGDFLITNSHLFIKFIKTPFPNLIIKWWFFGNTLV